MIDIKKWIDWAEKKGTRSVDVSTVASTDVLRVSFPYGYKIWIYDSSLSCGVFVSDVDEDIPNLKDEKRKEDLKELEELKKRLEEE